MLSKKRFSLFSLIMVAAMLVSVPVVVTAEFTAEPVVEEEAALAAAGSCESLIDLELPNTTITAAEFVNPIVEESPGVTVHGVWKSPESAYGSVTVSVPFCRVAATSEETINFEVWMPPAEDWNGRFNGVGNGALSGGINYPDMAGPLEKGYATASTDSGHVSPAPVLNDWMEDNPAAWVNFGYRAVNIMTRNAKEIIEAYYGQGPDYSYFTGCSQGGQEGLAEAQEYPADYDGIVSAAPATYQTRQWPTETYPAYLTHRGAAYNITEEDFAVIHDAVLAACDADDGAEDGLISNPAACDFDPATLLCEGDNAEGCLTAEQLDTVQKIYEGLLDPTTGELWYPGKAISSELGWGLHTGEPFIIPMGYWLHIVYDDPNWDWTTFDFTDPEDFAVLIDADARYGPIIDAMDPDLTALNELGGKLLLWHGWADQNISPYNTINYYNSVVDVVGDEAEANEFVRLFMVPGVQHCSGGPGPDTFDALAALEQWVEEGVAPEQMIGTNKGSGITRPLCPYPQEAQYTGTGSTDEAENWSCVAP